jgi:hypothetical protein
MKSAPSRTVALLFLATSLLVACGDDAGEGTIVVTAYGEDYVEEGVGADEMEDGWAVTFSRFDVTFADVSIAGRAIPTPSPVDLIPETGGEGHELGRVTADAGTYEDARFTIARVLVEGEAVKDEVEKTFAWTFEPGITYSNCETSTRVRAGEESSFEITIHADHLFFDSRVASEPDLRFQALADADENEDGEITRAELEAAGLGAYDPGSESHITSLWDYLEALVAELGHADGEAHCAAAPAGD